MSNRPAWMDCPHCSLLSGEAWKPTEESLARLCHGPFCYEEPVGVQAMEMEALNAVVYAWPKQKYGGLKSKCPSCGEFGSIKAVFRVSGQCLSHEAITSEDRDPEVDVDDFDLDYELDGHRCVECNKRFGWDSDQFFPSVANECVG